MTNTPVKPFRVVFMGPPGCGKGTQAQLLLTGCGLKLSQISTGDMLRSEINAGSEIGLKAKSIIEQGGLVNDDLVMQLLKDRLQNPGCEDGFLLDGFPRTAKQAEMLQALLTKKGIKIDAAVLIDVPEHILVERICGRRIHPSSGRSYHNVFHPPKKSGVDDVTGEALIQRKDDNEETLKKRLQSYNAQTRPVIDFYSKRNILRCVNGCLEPDKLSREIRRVIQESLASSGMNSKNNSPPNKNTPTAAAVSSCSGTVNTKTPNKDKYLPSATVPKLPFAKCPNTKTKCPNTANTPYSGPKPISRSRATRFNSVA